LNELPAGEYTINAALAGHFGVPVLMTTGDQIACKQIKDQLGDLETVVVKQGTGRCSAECLSPDITQPLIEQCAKRAVQRLLKKDVLPPYVLKPPIHVTVELQSSDMADRAMLLPGVARENRKLSFTAENIPSAYSAFRALVLLSYPR
jgi:D-amino peptidase